MRGARRAPLRSSPLATARMRVPITARHLPSSPRHRRAASRSRTISARRRPPASMHALHTARYAAAQTTAQAPSWAPSCAGWAPSWARAAAGCAPGRAPGMLPLLSPRMMTTTARARSSRSCARDEGVVLGTTRVPPVTRRFGRCTRPFYGPPPCMHVLTTAPSVESSLHSTRILRGTAYRVGV